MDRALQTALIDQANFEENLSALREVDARLAEQLAAVSIESANPVLGRDGSTTFRVRQADGAEVWFGRTSMPTVSGPALLESFRHGESNVVMPGIGQGIEAKLLAEQLGPHRAVFVIESDPLQLALALRLHQLAKIIRGGKLVLITGDDPAEALADFLVRREGYFIPDRMMARPWMTQAQLDTLRGIIERAGRVTLSRRAESIAAVEQTLAGSRKPREPHEPPRVVGLALHPNDETARRADELAAVAASAGVDWQHCVPDSPANGTVLAHLRMVAEHQPELAILLDHVRGDLPGTFPADLPVVSWLDAPGLTYDGLAARVGESDRVCATSPHLARQLASVGIPNDRIDVVPPAAVIVEPDGDFVTDRAVPESYRCDVAVFADGEDLTPAAWGIQLDTHETMYHGLAETLRRDADRFSAHLAGDYLERIEAKLHTTLEKGEVRNVMVRQIEQVIGPTTCRLAVVRALIAAGLRVHLYGRGWETHHAVRDVQRKPIADRQEERLALAGCRLVVHIDPTGRVSREVFHAAVASRPVLVRRHPFDDDDGGLTTLFDPQAEVLTFASAREAAALALHLLGDTETALHLAAAAKARVEADHRLAGRLCGMLKLAAGGRRHETV